MINTFKTKLQSIHPKQNRKQITHESNKIMLVQNGRRNEMW